MARNGLPSLRTLTHQQIRLVGLWGAIMRAAMSPEQQVAFDAFVLALEALNNLINPPPES